MAIGRIRVLVAGDIYVNRSLVRPFLEDDGYEVVGEAVTRDDVLSDLTQQQPDAVVIDDRLLWARGSGKLLQRIRRTTPDAKVVVVASAAGRAAGSSGVDAYLENGASLAALSALLGRFFAEPNPDATLAGVGAAAAPRASVEPDGPGTGPASSGGVTRFVLTVGVPVLVVWALIAMWTTGGGDPLPRADTTDLGADVVIVPQGIGPLTDAQDTLDRLLDAIEAGNYLLATILAKNLMDERETAIAGGYRTADLDHTIGVGLNDLATALPAVVTSDLQGIFGALFPVLDAEETPGGGSDVLLGPIIVSGGSGGAGTTGSDATGGGDDGGGGGGEGDGDDGIIVALGPGDGRAWGQSHKLTKGEGGLPPWATAHGHSNAHGHANANASDTHGHRGDPPGHLEGHGNRHGHANGRDRNGLGTGGGG